MKTQRKGEEGLEHAASGSLPGEPGPITLLAQPRVHRAGSTAELHDPECLLGTHSLGIID